eukprot:Clim_evm21s15 gene=Clim_evmTU21s15
MSEKGFSPEVVCSSYSSQSLSPAPDGLSHGVQHGTDANPKRSRRTAEDFSRSQREDPVVDGGRAPAIATNDRGEQLGLSQPSTVLPPRMTDMPSVQRVKEIFVEVLRIRSQERTKERNAWERDQKQESKTTGLRSDGRDRDKTDKLDIAYGMYLGEAERDDIIDFLLDENELSEVDIFDSLTPALLQLLLEDNDSIIGTKRTADGGEMAMSAKVARVQDSHTASHPNPSPRGNIKIERTAITEEGRPAPRLTLGRREILKTLLAEFIYRLDSDTLWAVLIGGE